MCASPVTGRPAADRSDWYKSFFTEPWLTIQRSIWPRERNVLEADFIQHVLRLPRMSSILDIPCGDGRLSVELASRQYLVTAVDFSAELIDDARRSAAERNVVVTAERRDMRDITYRRAFDAAIVWWGSFGYFDDTGNMEFLEKVSGALKTGGSLLLDVHVLETLLPNYQGRAWSEVGNYYVMEQRSFDPAQARQNIEWTITTRDGSAPAVFRRSSTRIYGFRELCLMLRQVGFDRFEAYSSLSRDPFELGSPRLYLLAVKQGMSRSASPAMSASTLGGAPASRRESMNL